MNATSWNRARRLLCGLHDHIRGSVVQARVRGFRRFADVAAVTTADTIYRVDRISEKAIWDWFEQHWPQEWPVQLVMEGEGDHAEGSTFPRGLPLSRTRLKCILDPIDGTRGLMHDKRSAWILTGLAPQRGGRTHLGDIEVAVMTELPTSKQVRSDQLSAIRGHGVVASSWMGEGLRRRALKIRPSQAVTFEHGFASFARFFPEGKVWLASLEEELWRALGLFGKDGGARVFDDQYISTGGQLFELIVGHDRLVGDLRPLAFAALGLGGSGLCCHPYDICTALILQEAAGVVETPLGRPLHVPLDTTSAVAWIGYANEHLARQVRPVLRRLIRERA